MLANWQYLIYLAVLALSCSEDLPEKAPQGDSDHALYESALEDQMDANSTSAPTKESSPKSSEETAHEDAENPVNVTGMFLACTEVDSFPDERQWVLGCSLFNEEGPILNLSPDAVSFGVMGQQLSSASILRNVKTQIQKETWQLISLSLDPADEYEFATAKIEVEVQWFDDDHSFTAKEILQNSLTQHRDYFAKSPTKIHLRRHLNSNPDLQDQLGVLHVYEKLLFGDNQAVVGSSTISGDTGFIEVELKEGYVSTSSNASSTAKDDGTGASASGCAYAYVGPNQEDMLAQGEEQCQKRMEESKSKQQEMETLSPMLLEEWDTKMRTLNQSPPQ